MADEYEKQKQLVDKLITLRFLAVAGGVVALITYLFLHNKPEALSGSPVTLTIEAELYPSQLRETLTVEVRRRGGVGWLHERTVTTSTLELTAEKRSGRLELRLPGSGNINYIVRSKTTVRVRGAELEGDSTTEEQGLTVKGDMRLRYGRDLSSSKTTQAGEALRFTYRGYIQPQGTGDTATKEDPFARLEPPTRLTVKAMLGPLQESEQIEITLGETGSLRQAMSLTRDRPSGEVTFLLPRSGTYAYRLKGSTVARLPAGSVPLTLQGEGRIEVAAGDRYLMMRNDPDLASRTYTAILRK